MTSRVFPPLRVLPATEAYDYEHFRSLLADSSVLGEAVAVCRFRAPLLAVPVGGTRRGGCMSFELLTDALEVRSLLEGKPGFTRLRVRWSPFRDTCHVVEWGGEAPGWDDVERGRFYGYCEEAIAEFIHGASSTPSFSALIAPFSHGYVSAGEGPTPDFCTSFERNQPHVLAQAPVSTGLRLRQGSGSGDSGL
ncbi:DUF6302 family protein [Streptomyces cavernicola]|uniref:DUF6302 family protein n=1 Tax=Streptomyces cavernicola TaxID=3043613 RepID=A0ABT6SL50_9ACTN|nr:DUF6302 family protein [Streptomyces sp. B-S-A6]MDI3408912.1 DUF6302 family protein [Streptomyces sp. B-S-A6]